MGPDTESQHVVPYEKGWAVRAENSERPSKTFNMKMDAITYAFDVAKTRESGKVVVHREDGTIQNVNITDDTNALMTILKS